MANTNFYPEGVNDVMINRVRENGSIVTAPEESFDTEAMRGSMQQQLSDNLGIYVVCEFLIGTQTMVRKEGILYSVGRSFVTLYEENTQTFITCDIFSIKFVTYYLPGQRPARMSQSSASSGMQNGNMNNRGNNNR